MRNTALPWSVSRTILYTAVSTLHSRTISIVFIIASSTLYNNCSVQWKYDLERNIPQIMNPLHQHLDACVQSSVQCSILYILRCFIQYSMMNNIVSSTIYKRQGRKSFSGNMSTTPAKWTYVYSTMKVQHTNYSIKWSFQERTLHLRVQW